MTLACPVTLQESVPFLLPECPWDVRGLGASHRQDLNCCRMGSPCSQETQAPPELPSATGIWVVLAPEYLAHDTTAPESITTIFPQGQPRNHCSVGAPRDPQESRCFRGARRANLSCVLSFTTHSVGRVSGHPRRLLTETICAQDRVTCIK